MLIAVLFTLLLSGCGERAKLKSLCNDNAEICNELAQDSWCKRQRVAVILNKIEVKKNNLDTDKYNLLIAYEGYIKCMSIAAQIQYLKLKEKTTRRNNNILKAKEYLLLLSKETSLSKHPLLLYYQWTRESNKLALKHFLQLEGSPLFDNSTSQYHLATYYIKRDPNKTLGLLYRALELHEPGTEITPDILATLATILTKKKQYKQAYIWLRTYQLLLDKPDEKIELRLSQYQKEKTLDTDFLDEVARATLAKINTGKFTSPKH